MSDAIAHATLDAQFAAIREHWSPRVIAAANGQYVKLAKVQGEFVWHSHAHEDEFFLVHKGTLVIRYRDRPDVVLQAGGFHVVPRGVEHITLAPDECWIMIFEPAETLHTGEHATPLTKSVAVQAADFGARAPESKG